MRKLFTLLLAIGFIFGMAACGGSSDSSAEESGTEQATEQPAENAEATEATEAEHPEGDAEHPEGEEHPAADSTATDDGGASDEAQDEAGEGQM